MGIIDVVSVLSEMPTLLKLKKGMVPRPATVADCFGARISSDIDPRSYLREKRSPGPSSTPWRINMRTT